MWNDNLFGSAAELGYWFLFALFPTLVSASSIVGLAVRHASLGELLTDCCTTLRWRFHPAVGVRDRL